MAHILDSLCIIHTLDLHKAPIRVGSVFVACVPKVPGPIHDILSAMPQGAASAMARMLSSGLASAGWPVLT